MTSKESLAKEIEEMYTTIKSAVDRTPEGLLNELESRCLLLARSAELQSDAQHYLDQRRGEEAARCHAAQIAPAMAKDIINAASSTEKRIYTLAERLNRTITHQLDAIRSILSYEKEGLRQNFYPNTTPV
jgi:hypothetical protein